MVNSNKRARRRRLAQEALQRETSHSGHQMDTADLSGPDSDRKGEEDHEVLPPPPQGTGHSDNSIVTRESPGGFRL